MKNFLHRYIDYLKDNPNHYWFKRKLYGWGWVPATREGWLVTLVFVLAVVSLAFRIEDNATPEEVIKELLVPLGVLLVIFFAIAYRKGEKPKWQAGFPDVKEDNEPTSGTDLKDPLDTKGK